MTNRRLTRSLLVAGLVLLLPTPAHPCQCGVAGSDADAVFVGRVERISRLEPWWRYTRRNAAGALCGWLNLELEVLPDWVAADLEQLEKQDRYGLVVTFRVTSSSKGVSGKTIDVRTGLWIGDCGYRFETGHVYRVWAYRRTPTGRLAEASGLETSRCTRTREISGGVEVVPTDDPHTRVYPSVWTPIILASMTGLLIGWLAQRLPVRRLARDVVACLAADICGVVVFGVLFPVFSESGMYAEATMAAQAWTAPRWGDSLTQTAVLFVLCLALSPALGLAARFKPTARLSRNHGPVFGVLGGAYGVILPMLMYWMRGNP